MKKNEIYFPSGRRAKAPILCVAVFCISIFPASKLQAQAKGSPELEKVFRQMDEVGRNFQTFSAKFTQKKYTAVLKEFDTPETGEFFYARAKDGAALLRQDFTSPSRQILTIKDGVATFYQPEIKQAKIYNLGKDKDKAEYLALGISQSPASLQKIFDISFQGSEILNGSACSVLVFKPKTSKVAALFSSITVWFKKSNGIPIQNKRQEPSGDYLLLNFSDEKLNNRIPGSKFEQKLPAGVDIQRIQ
jgi:outer membrane lipoprotein-sorting protein